VIDGLTREVEDDGFSRHVFPFCCVRYFFLAVGLSSHKWAEISVVVGLTIVCSLVG
jgi:hypothetical protein